MLVTLLARIAGAARAFAFVACAITFGAITVLLPVAGVCADAPPRAMAANGSVQVAFPPWDNAERLVIEALDAARKEVLVQAFAFTSRGIANALIAARRRGVDVRITADRGQTFSGDNSRIPELAAAGIPVFLEVRYAAAHNKTMVIDAAGPESVVITGSFNFTWGAQHRNAENLLILRGNPELARAYHDNWQRQLADALPYAADLRHAPQR
jgi:phosphatidylserine/phosphatidylglycerophosphate/cardiolipin synthase-like enzyme